MKTISIKNIQKTWYLIDIKDKILGRISTQIVNILLGKNKPEYTPNQDYGDNIILINANKIKLDHKKWHSKIYYTHSGHIGKLKEKKFLIEFNKSPKNIILKTIKGMLPKNKLSKKIINNIYIYNDENHKQISQKPQILTIR